MSTDWHAKGQEDYWRGVYEPPHSSLGDHLVGRSPEEIADIQAYNAGYHHAKSQDR